MDFGILLSEYIGHEGYSNFAVTFAGTLAECDAQEVQNGNTFGVSKSTFKAHHVKDKTMRDAANKNYSGEIVKFELRRAPRLNRKASK